MTFEPNKPFESTKPSVLVDRGLKPGQYRFQLVVFNERNQPSKPTEVVITIVDQR
jgi:hypothetical protein